MREWTKYRSRPQPCGAKSVADDGCWAGARDGQPRMVTLCQVATWRQMMSWCPRTGAEGRALSSGPAVPPKAIVCGQATLAAVEEEKTPSTRVCLANEAAFETYAKHNPTVSQV